MNKETQNLLWAILSKEDREQSRREYRRAIAGSPQEEIVERWFGSHNLSSDKEPEEMLTVSAKEVQSYATEIGYVFAGTFSSEYSKGYWRGQQTAIDRLFGKDTCLPDPSEPKPTPKFKIGDKVAMVNEAKISYNGVGTIKEVSNNYGHVFYRIAEHPALFAEQYLEPYTEPEPKTIPDCDTCAFEHHGSCEIHIGCDGTPAWCDRNNEDAPCGDYKPRQTEENMEEKELNLAELLKDAIGEEIYSPTFGVVKVTMANCNCIGVDPWNHNSKSFQPNGKYVNKADADISLYPSRDLYLKYPLDAAKAWQEWSESRKPKRWRAKLGEEYWIVGNTGRVYDCKEHGRRDDDERWAIFNYLCTKELAEQAAEAVRKCLESFHLNMLENENR